MADLIQENNIGTQFIVTIYEDGSVVDLSTTTAKTFIFQKPNKVLLELTPSFVTNGTDGQLTYTSTSGMLSPHGFWNLQAKITNSSGTWYSTVKPFTVSQNLNSV